MAVFDRPIVPHRTGNLTKDLDKLYDYISKLDIQLAVLFTSLDENNIPDLKLIRDEVKTLKESLT